ncbi:MAG: hypothetical protein COA79_03520 [Planctomycetota bacterium]|nr:MAG: hypothetical protein COA79_03520 [Planctomycetota bacterium]
MMKTIKTYVFKDNSDFDLIKEQMEEANFICIMKKIHHFELESISDADLILFDISAFENEEVIAIKSYALGLYHVPVLYYSNNNNVDGIPDSIKSWEIILESFSKHDLVVTIDLATYKMELETELIDHSKEMEETKLEREYQASKLALQAEEMAILKNEAQQALQVKNKFLKSIMFQLAEGMNGILGVTQVIDTAKLSDDDQELITSVSYSVEVLFNHIQNILNLTYCENNDFRADNKEFEIVSYFEQTKKIFKNEINNKKIKFLIDHSAMSGKWLGHEEVFQRVVFNLMENAINNSENSIVETKIFVEEKEGKYFLKLEFISQIDADDQHVKKAFDNSNSTEISFESLEVNGSGIYTTIKILEAIGGKLIYKIEDNVLTIEAFLPIDPVHRNKKVGGKAKGEEIRILLVEDNPLFRKIGTKILESMDYQIDLASNGQEALIILNKTKYDVIFMDCQMPLVNGYEAARKICSGDAGELNKETPIIALTAAVLNEDRKKCLEAGMCDYLGKPIKKDAVKVIIEKWV